MNWQFIHHNILREVESGYEIHLVDGTWFYPKRLKPVVIRSIARPDRLPLLRSGLKYIKTTGKDNNQDIERSITFSLLAS